MKKTNIKKLNISINGMHCKSCINLIESKVKSIDGIRNIKVNLKSNQASVEFDSDKVNLNKINSEIESLGYSIGNDKKSGNIFQGLIYGLIPHIGCIAFILASIIGATAFTQFFKPLLMNRYFFYILILVSISFATISSILYLRKNDFLSFDGVKRRWKYLMGMYGSTIGINLLFFLIIFPLLANASTPPKSNGSISNSLNNSFNTMGSTSSIKLSIDIPCSGHASLITQELKTLSGVTDIKFNLPNIFQVKYDSTKTTKQQILSLEIFNTYKATVIE